MAASERRKEVTANDWIVPGARVVLVRHNHPDSVGGRYEGPAQVSTIATVATKTFTVEGVQGRFDRTTLATGWQKNQGVRVQWKATSVEDERGREMVRELRLRKEARAASASLGWLKMGLPYELMAVPLVDLDATIEALAALRAAMVEVEHLR